MAYDVSCNGSERRLEECDLDEFTDLDLQCQDPASSAAGVECILKGTPNSNSAAGRQLSQNSLIFHLRNMYTIHCTCKQSNLSDHPRSLFGY